MTIGNGTSPTMFPRAAIALLGATVLLTGCGGADAADSVASSSSSATSSHAPVHTLAVPSPTTAAPVSLSPEQEAQVAATVTENVFTQNRDALSTQLVKSNALVEAQTDFRFDQSARAVVLTVTSVFKTGTPDVAYSLATGFAPVFWGPQATTSVRPESLVAFAVTVDSKSYLCHGPTMVALANRELSKDMFAQQCVA